MEEIKAGEFVRTKKGDIYKFLRIDKNKRLLGEYSEFEGVIYVCSSSRKINKEYRNNEYQISKHSFKIKDLIEEGDIIKYTPKGIKSIHIDIVRKIKDARSGNETLAVNLYSIGQIDIISIVTKEQMKAMEYEVE